LSFIPFSLLNSSLVSEKAEPDYYVCKDGFDPQTGGRFLSKEEKQIARRIELYDGLGKGGGVGSMVSGLHAEDERSIGGAAKRPEAFSESVERAWFGVGLGRNKRLRK
jgi:hypothetical protein